jgi:hypothetical protein
MLLVILIWNLRIPYWRKLVWAVCSSQTSLLNVEENGVAKSSSLVGYAARHWVTHA